jgi:hypothetical protein
MKLTGNATRATLTINGTRCGVRVTAGPWIEGVNPALIKLRPKTNSFPASFRTALAVENNSDTMTDYFEADCIRLLPGHPLYAAAQAIA